MKLKNREAGQAESCNLISYYNPKSPAAEQYRTIRTNIEFSSRKGRKVQTIAVTSAGPSEGKSTTAANLAIVFAQKGKKVLLVDSDLRKPSVHLTFLLENERGLATVLSGRDVIDEVIHTSNPAGIAVLTSGPIPAYPAELLDSNEMRHLVAELTRRFDIVIFDTPPVLAVTDAQIIGNLCDGTIIVAQSGKTAKEEAGEVCELLMKAQVNPLGVVMNRGFRGSARRYYYQS